VDTCSWCWYREWAALHVLGQKQDGMGGGSERCLQNKVQVQTSALAQKSSICPLLRWPAYRPAGFV